MHRILIFISLMPLLIAIVMRKLNGDRVLHRERNTHILSSPQTTARKMLDSIGLEKIDIRVVRKRWLSEATIHKDYISLSHSSEPVDAGTAPAEAHGITALSVGLYLLAQRHPELISRRAWALRFGHVFPAFAIMVIVFAIIVGKMPLFFALGAVLSTLGITTIAQILALSAERHAAALAATIIEKKRIFPRLADESAVTATTQALPWRSLVPGILSRFM